MNEQTNQSLASIEFTYDWYRSFLERLDDTGFDFRTFSEGARPGTVLLRHDVDLSIEKALTTARIEAVKGIEATYCVLLSSPLYNPLEGKRREQLRAIEALGHEVALHFSTHEYWPDLHDGANKADLESRVNDEREILGTVLSGTPETVSFHIPPSWVLDRSFDGFRNTYDSAYFSEMNYVADSCQRWRKDPPELPDPTSSAQILTHPGLWGEADGDFEERIDQSVSSAGRHAGRKAQLEFVEDRYDR
jgi:hypothetical protein